MYNPASFAQHDVSKLHAFLRRHSFATLVSSGEGGLVASHLPLLLDPRAGRLGHLLGHMARANPQWRQVEGEVLAIFQGPHTYISPSWYEEPGMVPTWNYVAVHAYGTLQLVDRRGELLDILRHAVAFYSDIIGLSNNHDAVTALAGYILAHKKTKITHRDIMRGDRAMARLDTVKKREEVADELAAWGWLERAPGPRANSQPQWNVNPLVHERFADRAKAEAERRKNAREMLHELYGKPRK